MNRSFTNTLRTFMDNYLPGFLRNNRFLLYPVFFYWYKGKNVGYYMNFKSIAKNISEKEFADAYRNLDCVANDRETDLNTGCKDFMMENIDKEAVSILDVGCGRGYWLNIVSEKTQLEITGCDLYDSVKLKRGNYVKGNIENLPFEDKSFDIVTSHHTIEHVLNPEKAVSELKRVAKKQLMIVTPCQKYFKYTFDLHLNFFPDKESLVSLVNMQDYICKNISGDWVFIGKK